MNGSLKDALKQRLDENYGAYMRLLQTRTVPELIAMAPEITAAQQLHEELLGVCDEDDAAFLLQFDDPLDVVRGYWAAEITGCDHSDEIGHMLWEIRDRELYEKKQPVQSMENVIGAVQDEDLTERGNPVSDVRQITTDDLRHMEDKEGLILPGCFEDPQVWIDGINDLLTDADILLDGSTFEAKNVLLFENRGFNNLLFLFEGVKLDMGRLAMWRLQTHDHFGGSWLSDYVPNRLGGFVHEAPRQKPTMNLLGMDGNIFSVMGTASQLLQMAGMNAENKEMVDRVTSCEDYDKALRIISEYVDTELSNHSNPQKTTKKKGKDAYER